LGQEIFHGIKPSMDVPEKEGVVLEEDRIEKEEAKADGHENAGVFGGV
jgi:hypothetical protein